MSGGYDGLKAFAFTVGVTVLIFLVLYFARRCNPSFLGQDTFSPHSWYSRGAETPLETGPNGARPPFGEKPRMWDVRIALWNPLCSQRVPRSDRLGLCKGEDEKRVVGCVVNGGSRQMCGEFLVSFPHPFSPFRVLIRDSWIPSHYPRTRCPMKMRPFSHPK